jgi:hypothetical protein
LPEARIAMHVHGGVDSADISKGKAPVGVAVGTAIYQDVLSASAGRAILFVGSGHVSLDSTLIAANTVGLLVAIRRRAEH